MINSIGLSRVIATEERNIEMAMAYEDGEKIKNIAERFGLSYRTAITCIHRGSLHAQNKADGVVCWWRIRRAE